MQRISAFPGAGVGAWALSQFSVMWRPLLKLKAHCPGLPETQPSPGTCPGGSLGVALPCRQDGVRTGCTPSLPEHFLAGPSWRLQACDLSRTNLTPSSGFPVALVVKNLSAVWEM